LWHVSGRHYQINNTSSIRTVPTTTKTDATTFDCQEYVAEYFKVAEQWINEKETNTLPSYFKLFKLVKQHSKEDHVWIFFWEGMHRHVAITLSLLCADITYDSTNCYIYRTLITKSIKRGDIKGFADPKVPPRKLIQDIFDGKRSSAQLLKSDITITAYIPTMSVKEIDTIMEVMHGQSQSERICPSGGSIGRIQSRFGVSVRSFLWNWSVRNGRVLGESSRYFRKASRRLSTGRKWDWHAPDVC
jgi:hypothetical protein